MKVMKNHKEHLLRSIGNTPCFEVDASIFGVSGRLFLKLENLNPTRTIKDRYASWVINHSESENIVDISTGNYGVSLSWFAALNNKKASIFLPREIQLEKVIKIKKYGGDVIFSDAKNLDDANEEALQFSRKNKYFYSRQFMLKESIKCSEETIGKEVLQFSKRNKILWDAIVAPYGSGATVKGMSNLISKNIFYCPERQDFFCESKDEWPNFLEVNNHSLVVNKRRLLLKEGISVGYYGGRSLSVAIELLSQGFENVLCVISDD